MRHPGRLAAIFLLVVGVLVGGAASPALAHTGEANRGSGHGYTTASYVALGDSFTAGQGAPPYLSGPCLRSQYSSYPSMVAAVSAYRLVANNACSGARLVDIPGQLVGVSAATNLVTVTVGGIDAGSNEVFAACAPDPASALCQAAVTLSTSKLAALAPQLAATYAGIAAAVPQARIVVLNYPRLFEPGLLPLADIVNAGTDGLNAAIQAAVVGLGDSRVTLVDVTQEFTNHGIGSRIPYINYVAATPLAPVNFHPNALGNALGYVGALVHDRVLRR
ncbi:GDSL-like lipase/acylhydrolase family protein [Cryobacterium psychrophilum]|nr:GDSL-like lipase/acylhydrolase family protein [Cryobacterium psychrophilum]